MLIQPPNKTNSLHSLSRYSGRGQGEGLGCEEGRGEGPLPARPRTTAHGKRWVPWLVLKPCPVLRIPYSRIPHFFLLSLLPPQM
jgi:hypothetical protein